MPRTRSRLPTEQSRILSHRGERVKRAPEISLTLAMFPLRNRADSTMEEPKRDAVDGQSKVIPRPPSLIMG